MNALASQEGLAKVDLYIAKAAPFAQPILHHIRSLLHKASPEIEETVKWSRPFFLHRGVILCNMAAFTSHCGFGFWGAEMGVLLRKDGFDPSEASGSFGRLRTLKDLPSDKVLLGYLRHAISLAESGAKGSKPARSKLAGTTRAPKPAIDAPPDFLAALKQTKAASSAYESLSPSCRREYLEWIVEAKRPETRERRIQTAVEQIAEGKALHWKYQNG